MDSIFEKQRKYHEELEVLERGIVDLYHQDLKTNRDKLIREFQTSKYLDSMYDKFQHLNSSYNEEEARTLESSQLSGPSSMHHFYTRLNSIKNYHASNPHHLADPQTQILSIIGDVSENFDSMFSGPEALGKYLDLNECYELYLDLINKVDTNHKVELSYIEYLNIVDNFNELPLKLKLKPSYLVYLNLLHDYLDRFYRLTQPLVQHDETIKEALDRFELEFKSGRVAGWEFISNENLFCSVCSLHFTKEVLLETHLKSKKHKKAEANQNQSQNGNGNSNGNNNVDGGDKYTLAKLEYLIATYFQLLGPIKEDTITNVERKQTLTEREREIEQELEDVEVADSDSDGDDDRIYNPLKLPLGWDGKPIPYWLYKLHGLGVEYPCEVCGNFVYMGRKAFERHFQEWRHAYGMRCLGIPNTRHFHEITSIEDVYSLWEQLKNTTKTEKQQQENVEEYEDSRGNVFNRKTYDDLKRQGLL